MMPNLILVVLTFMASGYSLSLVCILRRLRRDPRPASAAVFVFLASGIMHLSWAMSEPAKGIAYTWYSTGWLFVDTITLALLWWFVISSARFRKTKGSN